MLRRATIAALFLASACHQPFWTPPPPTPRRLPLEDTRAQLAGSWRAEFHLDSLRARLDEHRDTVVHGTLTLTDTVIANGPYGLKGSIEIDFTPMLGGQPACFRAGPGVFPADLRRDSVTIDLARQAADCGLTVRGRLSADTVVGIWYQPSFFGPVLGGKLMMVRGS